LKLIAGLGNPGSKYSHTRHNVGFFVIDVLCRRHKLELKPGKGDWVYAGYDIGDDEVILMKPLTYMNRSGYAVREMMEVKGISKEDLLVLVDDFQIPLGTIRVRDKGSDGGHNGLASISYELESDEYPRMRIGIGKQEVLRKDEFIDFVLGDFTGDEFGKLDKMYEIYADCVESFVVNGVTKTMNSFNKSYLEEKGNQTDQIGN